MKTLFIGDIHNHVGEIKNLVDNWDGNIVFVGDYFDDFGDNPTEARNTAIWLKESLTKPNRIHLMGNHDFHYYLPLDSGNYCSGYSRLKHEEIRDVLNKDDWDKIKFIHRIDNIWISHAGVDKSWFEHPIKGFNYEVVEEIVNRCVENTNMGLFDRIGEIWAADFYRGGQYKKGGILWNDWRNLVLYENLVQIVGHTPLKKIGIKSYPPINSYAYNVDCKCREFLVLTEFNNPVIFNGKSLLSQYADS